MPTLIPLTIFVITLLCVYSYRLFKQDWEDGLREEIRLENERLKRFKEKEKKIKDTARNLRIQQYKNVSIIIPVERMKEENIVEETICKDYY